MRRPDVNTPGSAAVRFLSQFYHFSVSIVTRIIKKDARRAHTRYTRPDAGESQITFILQLCRVSTMTWTWRLFYGELLCCTYKRHYSENNPWVWEIIRTEEIGRRWRGERTILILFRERDIF